MKCGLLVKNAISSRIWITLPLALVLTVSVLFLNDITCAEKTCTIGRKGILYFSILEMKQKSLHILSTRDLCGNRQKSSTRCLYLQNTDIMENRYHMENRILWMILRN